MRPVLELIPAVSSAFPDTAFRIHPASDLEFPADELASAEAEVRREPKRSWAPYTWGMAGISTQGRETR